MKHVYLFTIGFWLALSALGQDTIQQDFSAIFNKYEVDGCFVLYNTADSQLIQYNSAYCDTGYIPASTFKIPHSLIVLQEEVIRDTNQVIPWDGKEHAYTQWNKDQNLASAMKYSCVWAFSSFTESIEPNIYQHYIDTFNYGNKIIIEPTPIFWLAGQFRISANQQVDFLKKMYTYNLPIDAKHINLVKELILLEKTENYVFSAKTGSGRISETAYVMWLVGCLEKDGTPNLFAMNFESDNFNEDRSARISIVKDILTMLQLID